ncbi:MAG TPA: hypothetical protein VII97_01725 [Anaerolineales bacterium]
MSDFFAGLARRGRRLGELTRTFVLARQVAGRARPALDRRPVVFFNASARLSGLSQNSAFSLITSWAVRLAGVPVVHFVCKAGMSRCILGTDQDCPQQPPPCGMCIRQSKVNYTGADTCYFTYQRDETLAATLKELSLAELVRYEQPLPDTWLPDSKLPASLSLGALILPSLCWRMRLQSLDDDEPTRFLCREFILSAWNVACEFNALLERVRPQAAILFNGLQFPEAVAAWLCRRRSVRVITHETSFQPFSAFFLEGEVTTYSIPLPEAGLTPEQDAQVDADLQKRRQGDFIMAGVKFWKGMQGLPDELVQKASSFKQVVAVFTNVIFDTSLVLANVVFADMFSWLDELLKVFRAHPETLFVIRAHPDEDRPGKASRESVAMWVGRNLVAALPNVIFIPPQEYISSYELARFSKFVLTYNSTIGIEITLTGKPVLCAGRASFNEHETAYFELDRPGYFRRLDSLLAADQPEVPAERLRTARRYWYFRNYRFTLPFGTFIESTVPVGYVRLKKFTWRDLLPEQSATVRALLNGLLHEKRFELDA